MEAIMNKNQEESGLRDAAEDVFDHLDSRLDNRLSKECIVIVTRAVWKGGCVGIATFSSIPKVTLENNAASFWLERWAWERLSARWER